MSDETDQAPSLSMDFNISAHLLEMSPDPIVLVDKAGIIVFANAESEKLFGYHRAEIVEEPINKLVPERFQEHHLSSCNGYFKTPNKQPMRPVHLDAFAVRRNGAEIPVQVTLAPIKSRAGLVVMTTIRDLSERRSTEASLRVSERKYRKLIEAANDAIFVIDLDRLVVSEANESAERLLGLGRKEISEMPVSALWPPAERDRCGRLFTELSDGGRGIATGLCVRTSDGRDVPVEVSATTLELNEKRVLQAIFRDISVTEAAREALAKRARQQAAIAQMGQRALAERDIDKLMSEIAAQAARTLNVEYSKVLELQPDDNSLLLRAGVGWKKGLVGRATVPNDAGSQAGYTLQFEDPVIVNDVAKEERFAPLEILVEHGVKSGISAIIGSPAEPFGVLGIHSRERRTFTEDDANFLQAMANVLAGSIDRNLAEESLLTKDREIRQTYIDVFAAVTGGKLIILSKEELLDSIGRPLGKAFELASYEDLAPARAELKRELSKEFPENLNLEEMTSATGEALANAVKHSGSGRMRAFRSDGNAQVMIEDAGPGIDFSLLPKATLMAGFSTKQTLGIGFNIMLELCDRLMLSTKPGDTTVLLEMSADHP